MNCRWLALLIVAIAGPARAEAPKRDHTITVDDYFTQADLFQVALSPDGNHVAYTEGRWNAATDDRKTELWVVDVKSATPRRLTFDRANDRAPQWSLDGRTIYFAGNRKRDGEKGPPYDGQSQVWRIGVDGGAPVPVTRAENGIDSFELAKDGHSLYYVTKGGPSFSSASPDWTGLKGKYKDLEYGHGPVKFSQVWKLDLRNWRAEKLIDDQRVIREFAVASGGGAIASGGGHVAMITTPDDTTVTFEGRARVDIYDPRTKKITPLPDKVFRADMPSPYGWLEHLAWSGDGRSLAFNVIFDGYPAEIIVATGIGGTPTLFKLKRPEGLSIRGYGSPLQWQGPEPVLGFLGEVKGRVQLYRIDVRAADRQRAVSPPTGEGEVVSGFHFNPTGDWAAVIRGTSTHFPDVFLLPNFRNTGEIGNPPRRLTHVNPQADSWKLPKLSTVSWKGANGDPVEGILELPPDYQPGQRIPLVVEIHGGPTTATPYQLQFWIYGRTLLPAQGYAVLSPNYRGSTGYGDKFLTDLIGRENDLDVEDILKGVDALVERGIADPERLGVMGWSNGGYLTNCLIAKTTRFKAASSGAGIVDAVMEFGANDEPAYTIAFKKGFPWSNPQGYHRASPSYDLNKVRTPTLIHVGGGDERCPPAHSRTLYRALREYVHVPTELVVYPAAAHGLMKYQHRKAKMEWDLAWFKHYLRGEKGK